jgi:hypothetical protein
MTEIN